jgi:hypothetical protein
MRSPVVLAEGDWRDDDDDDDDGDDDGNEEGAAAAAGGDTSDDDDDDDNNNEFESDRKPVSPRAGALSRKSRVSSASVRSAAHPSPMDSPLNKWRAVASPVSAMTRSQLRKCGGTDDRG